MQEEYDQFVESESNTNKRKRPESPSSLSNDEKRRKLEPSRVLFIRQLPFNCTEQDIINVIPESEYGTLNIVLVRNNHTAFIEFESIDLAKKFLDNSNEEGIVYIKEREARVTWSERQELDKKPAEVETPSKVLHVTVVNARLPLLVNNMEKLFSDYNLEKITCFTNKQKQQQALVQFKTLDDAINAKAAIDGQDIFNNCKVNLKFSKIEEITVKYNNDKSKDFTRNDLPTGIQSNTGYQQRYDNNYNNNYHYNNYYQGYDQQQYDGYDNNYYGGYNNQHYNNNYNQNQSGKVILVNNLSDKTTCDELFILFGVWGDVEAVKIHNKKADTAFVEFSSPQGAELALQNTKGYQLLLHGAELVVQRSKHASIRAPKFSENENRQQTFKSYKNHNQHRFKGKAPKTVAPPSPFLHFANLHGDVTQEELKAYVEPYGTVKNIQLFGKKETTIKDEIATRQMAIVEFSSLSGAVRVLVNRHIGDDLRGLKPIISFSMKRDQKHNV